jgi:dTDP-4-dehydrorhamnose 3,5-epimerase
LEFERLGESGAYRINLNARGDARGSFTRTWCEQTFAQHGVQFRPVQGNSSLTRRRGTLRGMHFQRKPKADAKLVRCTAGHIYDVIVDLRSHAPTPADVFVNELSPSNNVMLYVPAGFAHGFQTLSDDVVVEYLMGIEYVEELSDGFRYDDPAVTIQWPEPITVLSDKDASWPALLAREAW